jgi:putative endonuclease
VNRGGEEAERLAAAYLERQGLHILERNYQCRFGEIDLIARDGRIVVFIEVRQRRSNVFGGAAASITPAKRTKLLRAARHYLSRHSPPPPCRFDALLLQGATPSIEWIRDAFGE